MSRRAFVVCAALCAFGGCVEKGTPVLELVVTPKMIVGATPIEVRVTGTAGNGKIGSGSVGLGATAGTLSSESLQLDQYGTAKTEFVCDPVVDTSCAGAVRVFATWTSDGQLVRAEVVVSAVGGTGGGVAGGGTGGGATGGANGGGGGASLPFPPDRVLMLGELIRGQPRVLADPRAPTVVVPALPPTAGPGTIVNGEYIYQPTPPEVGLRRFRVDPWDPNHTLPSPDKRADAQFLTSCGVISGHRISPAGRVLHRCPPSGSGFFVDGQSIQRTTLDGEFPSAFGDDDSFLETRTDPMAVQTSDGVRHELHDALGARFFASLEVGPTRPVAGGFLIGISSNIACDVYRSDLTGLMTRLGSAQYPCGPQSKLDSSGTLTTWHFDTGLLTIVEARLGLNVSREEIYADTVDAGVDFAHAIATPPFLVGAN